MVIFILFAISDISGLFPVFSCVLGYNSLIINAIHFSSSVGVFPDGAGVKWFVFFVYWYVFL